MPKKSSVYLWHPNLQAKETARLVNDLMSTEIDENVIFKVRCYFIYAVNMVYMH